MVFDPQIASLTATVPEYPACPTSPKVSGVGKLNLVFHPSPLTIHYSPLFCFLPLLVAVSIATSIAVSGCRFARPFRVCQTIRESSKSTAETQRRRDKENRHVAKPKANSDLALLVLYSFNLFSPRPLRSLR